MFPLTLLNEDVIFCTALYRSEEFRRPYIESNRKHLVKMAAIHCVHVSSTSSVFYIYTHVWYYTHLIAFSSNENETRLHTHTKLHTFNSNEMKKKDLDSDYILCQSKKVLEQIAGWVNFWSYFLLWNVKSA